MPLFLYKAKKGVDDYTTGEIVAESQNQAIHKLEDMGLMPISVVEEPDSGGGSKKSGDKGRHSRQAFSSLGRVRVKDIDTFTWQLASLIKARVPILRALSLIAQQTEKKSFRIIVTDLATQVKNGKMLSEAMNNYPALFNNLFLSLVKTGEKGGVLDKVLYKIAEHREKEQILKRKIQTALAYPMVMLVVGVGTVFIMLTFFMPKFVGIFERMNQELPLPTVILINTSNFMSANWVWFVFTAVFVFVVLSRGKHGSKKKFIVDVIKLHTPLIKRFILDAEIAKFSRTLGVLLKSGLPVYESLDLATHTLDNDALQEQLGRVGKDIIQQGSTLSSSLQKVGVFPAFAVNMIAVGEEGGKLDESLNVIADAYEKEVDQAVNIMTSLLEPLLILVVGGVVGFIVFAMLMPIFNIQIMAR